MSLLYRYSSMNKSMEYILFPFSRQLVLLLRVKLKLFKRQNESCLFIIIFYYHFIYKSTVNKIKTIK